MHLDDETQNQHTLAAATEPSISESVENSENENLDEIDLALQQASEGDSSESADSGSSDSDSDDQDASLDSGESELESEEDVPRTANEIEPEIPQLPADFEISEKTKIELAGTIFSVGPAQIVVQALSSGEYKILDEGTIFCTSSRVPLGILYETFGPVEKPFYVIRIQSDQDLREVYSKDQEIFYIATSKFAFTDQFRVKGTDASNLHDEEVPLEEQEFSDDEQEALAKGKKRRKRTKSGKKKVQLQEQPMPRAVTVPQAVPAPQAVAAPQPVPLVPMAQPQNAAQLLQWQQQLQMQQMQLQAQWQMMQQMQPQAQAQAQPQAQPQAQAQPQVQPQPPKTEEEPHQWP